MPSVSSTPASEAHASASRALSRDGIDVVVASNASDDPSQRRGNPADVDHYPRMCARRSTSRPLCSTSPLLSLRSYSNIDDVEAVVASGRQSSVPETFPSPPARIDDDDVDVSGSSTSAGSGGPRHPAVVVGRREKVLSGVKSSYDCGHLFLTVAVSGNEGVERQISTPAVRC